jgi:hypothetical protein
MREQNQYYYIHKELMRRVFADILDMYICDRCDEMFSKKEKNTFKNVLSGREYMYCGFYCMDENYYYYRKSFGL